MCTEMTCGCILHVDLGYLRRCAGLTSRSLTGRMIPKPEGAEKRHNESEIKING